MRPIKCNRFILLISILSLAALSTGASASEKEAQIIQLASSGGHKLEGSKSMQMGGGKHSAMRQPEGSKSKMSPHGSKHGGHGKKYGHGKSYGHGSKGHHGGHGQSHCPFAHILKFKTQLGLTEDQVAAINDQKFEFSKNGVMSKAKLKIARMDLKRLLHSATIDEAKIRELAATIGAMEQEKIKAKIEVKLTLLKTLTDEQRKKLNQMYRAHQ